MLTSLWSAHNVAIITHQSVSHPATRSKYNSQSGLLRLTAHWLASSTWRRSPRLHVSHRSDRRRPRPLPSPGQPHGVASAVKPRPIARHACISRTVDRGWWRPVRVATVARRWWRGRWGAVDPSSPGAAIRPRVKSIFLLCELGLLLLLLLPCLDLGVQHLHSVRLRSTPGADLLDRAQPLSVEPLHPLTFKVLPRRPALLLLHLVEHDVSLRRAQVVLVVLGSPHEPLKVALAHVGGLLAIGLHRLSPRVDDSEGVGIDAVTVLAHGLRLVSLEVAPLQLQLVVHLVNCCSPTALPMELEQVVRHPGAVKGLTAPDDDGCLQPRRVYEFRHVFDDVAVGQEYVSSIKHSLVEVQLELDVPQHLIQRVDLRRQLNDRPVPLGSAHNGDTHSLAVEIHVQPHAKLPQL
mmetsp:Transcript_3464/g.7467  ORF Transcript_3464/g.7467 Transcript_3464/m.7467 type:complete len:407 (+) Transcript_3464:303-1523(+)